VIHISRSPLFAFMCVIVLAFPAAAYASDSYKPPAGISPTSARLTDVLVAAEKADGSAKSFSTSVEEGRVAAWGLKGNFRVTTSGEDFRSMVDLGALSWQRGRVNGQLWRRNENGLVVQLHDKNPGEELRALIGQYKNQPISDFRLLGETSGPSAAYVVEAHPQGGLFVYLFLDKKSYLLTRAEVPLSDGRDTYTYSDFHKTASYTDAWHEHVTDGDSQNDVDYFTTAMRYNAALEQGDTAMPQSNDKLVQFPAGVNVVKLPARLTGNTTRTRIVSVENQSHDITQPGDMTYNYSISEPLDPKLLVALTINGRGYDFYLDSGAGGIFVDSDIVDKLGLKTLGPSVKTKFGNWTRSFAIIPDVRVGDIEMTNVVVHTLPAWHVSPQVGTDVVGLVGYDFIANAVLAIDYEKGTVTATNPFLFVPPNDAIALPATLDEGVPYISVQVGEASSDHFIVDTGSPNCFLFSSFANAHPDDVKDQGAGVAVNHEFLPYYGWTGVSGDLNVHATEVKAMTIAGMPFYDWIMFKDLGEQSPGDDNAGLIGYDFLKYFTVYLDYPQNQIFLLPNSRMKTKANH
jgi:hypothetical protein